MQTITSGGAATAKRYANAKRRAAGSSLQDVANLAKVSRATAARVFSDEHLVAEKTRGAVRRAARMLNYSPNLLARGLAGGRTNMIGVLWALSGTPEAIGTTHLLAEQLEQCHFMPYITDAPAHGAATKNMLREFARRNFDGIVMQIGDARASADDLEFIELLSCFRAVVLVSAQPLELGFDEVVCDRLSAYREAARHFANIGRRRPAIITAHHSNIQKVEAFFDEARQCGMEVLPDAVIDIAQGHDLDATHARGVLETRFSDTSFPFDAVMCSNDELAMLTGAWLTGQGLRIPDDVALAGFDDMRISRVLNPPLATADRRRKEVADTIATLLTSRLDQPDLPVRSHDLPMRFLWRESAGRDPMCGASGPVIDG
ncbi:MAG: LacI family DNA-binding transcriptional regulator [Lentisphaerae bacterium]|nr:LacI family DNA-binding transcriptional regulator [Lentisphaerota bacterium]